jgi:hypothetical protein
MPDEYPPPNIDKRIEHMRKELETLLAQPECKKMLQALRVELAQRVDPDVIAGAELVLEAKILRAPTVILGASRGLYIQGECRCKVW